MCRSLYNYTHLTGKTLYLLWSCNSNRIQGLREYFHEDEIILIRNNCFWMEPCLFKEIPDKTLFMTTLQEQNQKASPFHVVLHSVCAKNAYTAVSQLFRFVVFWFYSFPTGFWPLSLTETHSHDLTSFFSPLTIWTLNYLPPPDWTKNVSAEQWFYIPE